MRATFASSAVKLMTDLGFDGLDIDYEYVTDSTQASQLVDLLKKTREKMDAYAKNTTSAPFLLSFAAPAGPAKYTLLDMEGMDRYLDFWNFMGFDYTGSWSTASGHMANVFGNCENELATPFNTSSGIEYYTQIGGVPAGKINLGSPLYGRSFNYTSAPGTPFNGVGDEGSFGVAGVWDYKALPVPGFNATTVELPEIGASYSYDASQKYMISYDTPTIAGIKADYIKAMGLGGAMWWEVSMDKSGDESLISSTVQGFGGVNGLDKSPNHLNYPTSIYNNLRNGFPNN
jgi:chitinase